MVVVDQVMFWGPKENNHASILLYKLASVVEFRVSPALQSKGMSASVVAPLSFWTELFVH